MAGGPGLCKKAFKDHFSKQHSSMLSTSAPALASLRMQCDVEV